jgi:hypothetical protein
MFTMEGHVLDSDKNRAGGDRLTPLQIAHHPLFTAHEKIRLLQELKAEVTGVEPNEDDLGFSAGEIDEAIAEVRLGAQDAVGTDTVLRGDA